VLVAVVVLSLWTTVVADGCSSSSLICFASSSSVFVFVSVFFFCFSRCRAASMMGRTVAAVVGGAASNGEEREAGERDYCSSPLLCYLFFFVPCIL
jgi:hypothetical protein